MLSFSKGEAIATVEGGKFNNKILKLDNAQNKQIIENESESDDEYNNMTEFQKRRMKKVMRNNNTDNGLNITLYDGQFIPLPRLEKKRTVWYLSAPSDGGKSTLGEKIAKQYKKHYPKNKIFIFSTHDDDFLDLQTAKFIRMDSELCEKGLKCEMLANSLCIFDDIDTLGKININETVEKIVKGDIKKITKKKKVDLSDNIRQIRDDLLQNGRHHNISMICMTHLLNNFKQTKLLLSEADYIIYFNTTGKGHVKRFLEVSKGFEKDVIKKIMSLPTRWTLITNKLPINYVLTENSCHII